MTGIEPAFSAWEADLVAATLRSSSRICPGRSGYLTFVWCTLLNPVLRCSRHAVGTDEGQSSPRGRGRGQGGRRGKSTGKKSGPEVNSRHAVESGGCSVPPSKRFFESGGLHGLGSGMDAGIGADPDARLQPRLRRLRLIPARRPAPRTCRPNRQRRVRPDRGLPHHPTDVASAVSSVAQTGPAAHRFDRHAELVSDRRPRLTAFSSCAHVVDVDRNPGTSGGAERVDARLEQPGAHDRG